MSSEIFEKNVGEMLRRAGLRPDEARAKERFVREIEVPGERRSWKVAAAAAAILLGITLIWSARSERPFDSTTGQSSTPESPTVRTIRAQGGNDLLAGRFVLRGKPRPPKVIFTGRTTDRPGPSAFPDGTLFSVRVHHLSEKLEAGRLVAYIREARPGSEEFRKGEFSTEWEYKGPERVAVEAFVNDALQERDVAKALKVPAPQRTWTFEGPIWNQDVLGRLDSQYPEALEILDELRGALRSASEACSGGRVNFKSLEEVLTDKLGHIESRAGAFGKKSLFPASMGVVEYAARDLAVQVSIFTWENGTFAGPKSYHTNNQLAKTFRGDPFSFYAYQRYLDEAVAAAGRELLLWILRDADLAGFEEGHRKLLRDHALKPGVEEFAARLLQLPVVGTDYAALEAEVRILKK